MFPENLGSKLSIDETSLSHGELYTLVTNKAAKGKKKAIVAIVAGTKADDVIAVLARIPQTKRNKVAEATLDMSGSMEQIVRRSFPYATRVTDRFHVQRLAVEALQEMRIKYRWQALDQENQAIEKCKRLKKTYEPLLLENGDTLKQLLARSRYVLYKRATLWTERQKQRAELLFEYYPDLKRAYNLSIELSNIYQNTTDKLYGMTRLAKWHEKVRVSGFRSFNTISRTIQNHYRTILNYFDNRSTNASAESFNAKIKAFRAKLRGVRNIDFFLFRLTRLYA
ncbi:transposase [Sphingobacterium sp. SRCM116780]|uniref:ISAon1 family transposase n=1 Tax=Sphingobacterium sp. SRCM116780 TaxID=2907623 RepID=UPI001F38EE12|nr:transposase [Sphingobacterium sp. SRCM116780]UIR56055.1 transposase [Sphingobacterium sp. SRCM116780]